MLHRQDEIINCPTCTRACMRLVSTSKHTGLPAGDINNSGFFGMLPCTCMLEMSPLVTSTLIPGMIKSYIRKFVSRISYSPAPSPSSPSFLEYEKIVACIHRAIRTPRECVKQRREKRNARKEMCVNLAVPNSAHY